MVFPAFIPIATIFRPVLFSAALDPIAFTYTPVFLDPALTPIAVKYAPVPKFPAPGPNATAPATDDTPPTHRLLVVVLAHTDRPFIDEMPESVATVEVPDIAIFPNVDWPETARVFASIVSDTATSMNVAYDPPAFRVGPVNVIVRNTVSARVVLPFTLRVLEAVIEDTATAALGAFRVFPLTARFSTDVSENVDWPPTSTLPDTFRCPNEAVVVDATRVGPLTTRV